MVFINRQLDNFDGRFTPRLLRLLPQPQSSTVQFVAAPRRFDVEL
jgi:hypothetical protein